MTEPAPRPGRCSTPFLVVVLMAVLLAVLAECFLSGSANASVAVMEHPRLTDQQRDLLDLLGPDVVGAPIVLPEIRHVRNWYPLQQKNGMYLNATGSAKGDQERISLKRIKRNPAEPLGSSGGSWSLHASGINIKYLTESTGHLRLPTETSIDHGVITIFDPPEPVLLAGVAEGESRTMTSKIKVYDLHNPTDMKYQGSVKETYTDLGGYVVNVPRGTYEARLISVRTVGKVGPADIETEDLAFYARGTGRVAYIERKHVSAFLFYDKTTQRGMVLAKLPAATPAPAESTSPATP